MCDTQKKTMKTKPAQLTVNQVAETLNISRNTAINLILTKQIPAYKIGRTYRVDAREITAYKLRNKVT